MARINLLPWREELRKQRQQEFIAAIGGGILMTCLILLAIYLYIEGLKDYQTQRNTLLKNEIAMLDKKIEEIKEIEEKKSKLLTKIEVIQQLQESRPEIVHLFDELAKITPEGIFLTKFDQVGSSLNFEGKAESNARVSAYMRGVEHSSWLNTPVLTIIKGDGDKSEGLDDFKMTAKQGKLATDKTEGAKQ